MRCLRLTIVCLGVAVSTLSAQSRNVERQSQFRPAGVAAGEFSDVWGYAAPDGRELALLGAKNGLYVIECTDPQNPVQRGFFPNSLSGWADSVPRDIRTYRDHAYVVSEGGGGMQIIDLQDPGQPRLVTTWGTSQWAHAHNIAVDLERGVAYPCGTSVGLGVVALTDPANPQWLGAHAGNYVHDLFVRDGVAHLAEYNASSYRIIDATALPTRVTVGTAPVPSAHTAWPTRDNRYAVTGSEQDGGDLRVFDISVPRLPAEIASYRTGPADSVIHNAMMHDRLVHIAYYAEGYRCVDLSDPHNPVEVGHYVTSPGTGTWSGAWGIYPFQPSGNVYISDTNSGLHVLRPVALSRSYGAPTAGGGQIKPRAYLRGAAYLGNPSFGLEVESARPDALAVLVVGVAASAHSLGPLQVLVETAELASPAIAVPVLTDASGAVTLGVPVPDDVQLAQARLYFQAFIADPGAVVGIAATQGIEIQPFAR
ncbi:MAG: choice-of-anchor B family protein [Planctomycetota bacterium]